MSTSSILNSSASILDGNALPAQESEERARLIAELEARQAARERIEARATAAAAHVIPAYASETRMVNGRELTATCTQTRRIEGSRALFAEAMDIMQDISTIPPNFTVKIGGREYYQPQLSVSGLMGMAVRFGRPLEHLGYGDNFEGAAAQHNRVNQACAAMIIYKRMDHALLAYRDLKARWNIHNDNEPSFTHVTSLRFWQFWGDSEQTIRAKERDRKQALNRFIAQMCDAQGVPLDPALSRIYIPTSEEKRDYWGLSAEKIAQVDIAVFEYKLVQRDSSGNIIPPRSVPPHPPSAVIEEVQDEKAPSAPAPLSFAQVRVADQAPAAAAPASFLSKISNVFF